MRGLLICVTLSIALAASTAIAKPQKVRCNPNGTANESIGCIDNANVDLWEKLNRHYARYLDEIYDKCAKENPGGGSGGHESRATCVTEALETEADRVNLKR